MTHPTIVARYRKIRERTGCLTQVGELSAEVHMQRLDPWGLLSLGVEIGEERAAEILKDAIQGGAG